MRHLKSLHLAVGIVGIVAFVLTGQYLAIFLHGLNDMADGPRLLYRTSHLYLMWSSLLNLLVGCYFMPAAKSATRKVQAIASVMLLVGPVLMLVGFFTEWKMTGLDRPFTGWGNYLALAGAILHAFTTRRADEPASVQS